MNSFTDEGMRLAGDYANALYGPSLIKFRDASEALRSYLQAMEEENKRLRNSYLELRGIFRANMLRAYPGKDVDAEIDRVLEVSAAPQEGRGT